MYQVFVSHKTDELPLLQDLVGALNQVGIGVYIAERSPWPGIYLYDQKIIPAIANSDCMLVLLTSNSATSPDVNQEIGIARSHNKPIVALVENGVQVKGLLVGREAVPFDRHDPLPALQAAFAHFQSQAAMKDKAESDRNAALLIGGLALLILAGWSKKTNQDNSQGTIM
jgi:hypothetical protein